jgi:glutamate/tyrosine decarboxylase-like PLP-dependent enzyme
MSKDRKEVSLDPENWEEFKTLGHRMVEDALNHLQNTRDYPNKQQPEEALTKLLVPLSEEGEGEEQVYQSVFEELFPYGVERTRPQFWGFVAGSGSPYGVLVDMLISSRNAGAISADYPFNIHAISWIKELLEIPKEYSGVFVSGGTEANYTGIAIARNAKANINMKTEGMQGVKRKMVLYGSTEMHHCIERTVELLGLGSDALRWIPVDGQYRMKLDDLEKAIAEDKKQGLHPFCIIGNVGTVNSGAFDDLHALADLCKREDMWLHVDGAYGAWIRLSETHKHLADGLERVDSIAVDLHKWMNMPYPIGVTLVKDKVAHYRTFVYGHDAKYLDSSFGNLDLDTMTIRSSLALSRGNTGLKAYMLLRAFGKNKYRQLVQQNIDGINYLAGLLEKEPLFELTAPVASNVVCFRYNPGGLSEEHLEKLNRTILSKLWDIVLYMISDTTLNGRYMLRACNVNHRTKLGDFDELVHRIKKIAEAIDVENIT